MMYVLSNLVGLGLWIYQLIVIGRVLAGWIGVDPKNAIAKALYAATEPVFQLVRPIARKIPGPLDWTPALVLLGLVLLRRVL